MNSKNITMGVLGGIAFAGIAYVVYTKVKGSSSSTTTINNPAHLSVPTGASTVAALKAANPNSTNAQIAALLTQLGTKQVSQQVAKGGAPPSASGNSAKNVNGYVNGKRVNSDGSTDTDNGDGTFTETEKDGTTTRYTSNGIPIGDGDKIAFDKSGNMVVQHDNGDGTYTETEKDGSSTVYVMSTGKALGDGDVYQNGSLIHDNGDGTYTETESDGSVTIYTEAGNSIPSGYNYDTKSGLAYNPSIDVWFNPISRGYQDSNGNAVDELGNPIGG